VTATPCSPSAHSGKRAVAISAIAATLAFLLAPCTPALAVDCPAPYQCIDPCTDLATIPLDGPPDGIGGLEVMDDNACDWHEPVTTSTKRVNRVGCFDSRCKLNLSGLRILGGSPVAMASCLACTAFDGTDCTAVGWIGCTVHSSTTVVTTSTTTSSTTTTTLFAGCGDGTTFVCDAFERSTLGGDWGGLDTGDITPWTDACAIENDSDLLADGTEGALCRWQGGGPTPALAQYACGQVVDGAHTLDFPRSAGVCVGMTAGGNSICCFVPSDDDDDVFYRATEDGWGFLLTGGTGAGSLFQDGDYIGIERHSDGEFTCYRSTNGTTWTNIDAGVFPADPGFNDIAAGIWGAAGGRDAADIWRLEKWEGGNGTLPTSRACGTPP
jgi:hypothetical protein